MAYQLQQERALANTSPPKNRFNFIKKQPNTATTYRVGGVNSGRQGSGGRARESSNGPDYFNRAANDGKASVVTTNQGWGVGNSVRKNQTNHFQSHITTVKKVNNSGGK